MAEAFECPNCRASLVYDAASRRLTVYCDYCNSTVIVPDSLRRMTSGTDSEIIQIENLNEIARLVRAGRISEAIEQVQETFGVGYDEAYEMVDALERNEVVRLGDTAVRITAFDSQEVSSSTLSRSSGRVIGCIVVAILVITLIGVLAPIIGGGAVLFGIFESQRESEPGSEPATSGSLAEVLSDAVDESLPEPSPTPGFASVIHEFGGQEGTGPGFFNDTRQIGWMGREISIPETTTAAGSKRLTPRATLLINGMLTAML